jgi:hypothetical protein
MAILTNAAESNRAQIRLIEEVTWGTTPASGKTELIRLTEGDPRVEKETVTSQEIRADRMVPDIVEVGAMTSGSVSGEFSAGTWDTLFEGFLLGTWSQDMNFFNVKGSSVAVTDSNTITISGQDATPYLTAGNFIKLEGFSTVSNNGYFEIDAVAFGSGNTTVDVVGTPLTTEVGSFYTRLYDANDVILVSDTTAITSGNTINGGGSNSFAGKGLKVGQKIYMEGLGKGSGSIVAAITDPTEGATITVSDGEKTVIYEVRTNAALVAVGRVHIPLSGTPATMAASIASAVNLSFTKRDIKVSATVSSDTVTLTNNRGAGGSIATSDATAFTVTNFSGGDATKYGFFTIASLPNDDTIVTIETLTADANSGSLNVVIKGSHLRNPGVIADITKRSYTLQTSYTDVDKHFLFKGQRVGSFEMGVTAKQIVSIGFSFMGGEGITSNTDVLGASPYTALDTTPTEVMNATDDVGSIFKNGSPFTGVVREISLEGDASLGEQSAVGNKFPAGIRYGRISVTGSMEAYFTDFTLYNDFINHVTSGLQFQFTDNDSNGYFFTLPALNYTEDNIEIPGIDDDVMEPISFETKRDPTLKTQFMIDRFSSTFPFSAA